MDNFQWYDYLRILTVIITFISLYLSGLHAIRQWSRYTDRLRSLWWVFNAFLFLTFEGTIENIVKDLPGGPRTLLSFIVSVIALRALLQNGGFVKEGSKHENRHR